MEDAKLFVCAHSRKVDDAIDLAIVEHIIPQLRVLIDTASQAVIKTPNFEDSPFAKEFAGELIIKSLAGLLALTSFEDVETARPIMLEPKFTNWWFGIEDEE